MQLDTEVLSLKLSEKIIALRKTNNMTQEELAAICHVSRQSISKWEADIALPETEKLLLLGEVFHVSMDVLLKDDLLLQAVSAVSVCGDNAVRTKKQELFEGILIKESITNDTVIDLLHIHKVELWNAGGQPKYWTALFFTCDQADFPLQISKVMRSGTDSGGNWFVDFQSNQTKYIVFKDQILKYRIGNQAEKDAVRAECRKMGIPDEQMNWPEQEGL